MAVGVGSHSTVWQKYSRIRGIDPRLLQCLALGSYAILGPLVSGFERSFYFLGILLIYTVSLDAFIGKFYFRRINFPFTPLVIAFATSILIDSPSISIYLLAATVGIGTKAFFTIQGRHFLNPANSGVVLALLAMPQQAAAMPKLFSVNPYFTLLFLGVGIFVSSYAGSIRISVLWLGAFLFFAVVRSLYTGADLVFSALPIFAPTFMLYTFHMITDPATIPRRIGHQIGFVFLVAALDAYLRYSFVPFSNFYALFFVSAAMPLILVKEKWFTLHLRWPAIFVLSIAIVLVMWRKRVVDAEFKNNPVFSTAAGISANPVYMDNPVYGVVPSKEEKRRGLFSQAQDDLGVNFRLIEPDVDKKLDRQLRIQWVAPGVAVADFNRDGWMDFFVPNSNSTKSKNSLFINRGGKSFSDEAEKWKIASVPENQISQAAVPFDYDKDGLIDLLITGPGCVRLWKNTGKKFEDVTREVGPHDCKNSIIALPFDANGDGLLDLYLARYFSENIDLKDVKDLSYFGPNSFARATNGGVNALYLFKDGKFQLAEEFYKETKGSWTWDVGLADIRGDGGQVLVVGNDFGDDYYVDLKKGRMVDITDQITIRDTRSSMNVSFGHWDSAQPQIVHTNMLMPGFDTRGSFFWQYDQASQSLKNYQNSRGAEDCGWPWGVAFGDFNLDGEEDLYTSNGMISQPAPVNQANDPNYFRRTTTSQAPPEAWGKVSDPGSVSVFKFIDSTKNFAGHQRDCLFIRNPKTEKYENISVSEPGIEKWDGRAVAKIDYDNNGTLELIVSTQGSPLRFLKSNLRPNKNWVGFDLLADPSEKMGARIEIQQEGHSQFHWYQNGKSGFLAFSDPRIHFGLRGSGFPVMARVQWKDGRTTVHGPFAPGKYHTIRREP
jgi:enediyne biosynthesis protein E4